MAVYVGVNNVARKVSKIYVGVSGVARQVKKAYVGVNNVARLVYTSILELKKTTSSLSQARGYLAATNVGGYVLFGGGEYKPSSYYSTSSSTVDAFNETLTRTGVTGLSNSLGNLAATNVGDYALFGGGDFTNGGNYSGEYGTVNAYDTSLTRSIPAALGTNRTYLAAASNSSYAFFGGGSYKYNNGNIYTYAVTEAYNASLTKNANISQIHSNACKLAASHAGSYAIFGGGWKGSSGGSYDTYITCYDTSASVRYISAGLNNGQDLAATNISNYILFGGGGDNSTTRYDYVIAYSSSLSGQYVSSLSQARNRLAAASITNYAIFGGGYTKNSFSNVADAYNKSLTKSTPAALGQARGNLAASNNSKYAIFGGGIGSISSVSPTFYSNVDAYYEG